MTSDEHGTCECGAPGETVVDNGKYVLDICLNCYDDEETLWMEAVMEFNYELIKLGVDGLAFAELDAHLPPVDPTLDDTPQTAYQRIDYQVGSALLNRRYTRDGDAYLALVAGAIARYDEWFGPPPLTKQQQAWFDAYTRKDHT